MEWIAGLILIIVIILVSVPLVTAHTKKEEEFGDMGRSLKVGMTLEEVLGIMKRPADVEKPPMYRWEVRSLGSYRFPMPYIVCVFEYDELKVIELSWMRNHVNNK